MMRRATDRAEEVLGGRAEIASMVAHDVRGPVGSIASLATTTRTSYDRLDDAQRLEFVGMIESEAGRLLRLVDQIALALKVDAGTLEARRTRQPARAARAAIRSTRSTPSATSVLGADDDDIAAIGRHALVQRGHPSGHRQRGALLAGRLRDHHRPPRGRRTRRSSRSTTRARACPSEQRDAVFERFARWRPTGYEDRSGSGLGLFICRAIVREHGGEASLDERSERRYHPSRPAAIPRAGRGPGEEPQ